MPLDLNLKTIIQFIAAIGSISAALVALFALRQSNKQLKIQQTPYVVLDHIKGPMGNKFGFAIKNIGKGPAVGVTFSVSDKEVRRNDAFFSNDQPHSANFSAQEESHYWLVDSWRLDGLVFDANSFAFLYIFFESQSGILYSTKVKIKKNTHASIVEYIVMENSFKELK